jgi:hypothetical protein
VYGTNLVDGTVHGIVVGIVGTFGTCRATTATATIRTRISYYNGIHLLFYDDRTIDMCLDGCCGNNRIVMDVVIVCDSTMISCRIESIFVRGTAPLSWLCTDRWCDRGRIVRGAVGGVIRPI